MLKQFHQPQSPFTVGSPVFVVTRTHEILTGFVITALLGDLVSLDRSPIPGSTKQGFTISGDRLKPNWCEGRKSLLAAFTSHDQAEQFIAQRRRTR